MHEWIKVGREEDWRELSEILDGFRDGVIHKCVIEDGGHVRSDAVYVVGEGSTAWLLCSSSGRRRLRP